jgi:hypothetical protein
MVKDLRLRKNQRLRKYGSEIWKLFVKGPLEPVHNLFQKQKIAMRRFFAFILQTPKDTRGFQKCAGGGYW